MAPQRPIAANDTAIARQALEALGRTTGLHGRLIAQSVAPGQGTAVEIKVDDHIHQFAVETKTVDRFATLATVKARFDRQHLPGLLAAPYITPELAERCRELGLPFIDTAGNAYFQAPGLHIYVTGQRRTTANQTTTFRAFNATGLRVIFTLLCRPELLNAPYREITQAAGVALGTVGWVFNDLNARGYLIGGETKGGRRLVEPKRLLDDWVVNYPIKLRPKLDARRFRAADPNWWQRTDLATYGAYWGGEVAADRLTGYLKPEKITVYLRDEPGKFIIANRLQADPNGDIELLKAFWNFPPETQHPDVVPPLLAYADLMASFDPRNHETAQILHERLIANVV
jgi:hypothetical protein